MFRTKKSFFHTGKTIYVGLIFFLMIFFVPLSSSQTENNTPIIVDTHTMKSPEFTLTIIIDGHGHVNLNPPGGVYYFGTPVTLEAVADPSWRFTQWSGGAQGTTNPIIIIIEDDTTVTAYFGLVGDIDHDGDVDLSDLAQLLGHYGMTSGATYEYGDINGDGDVDLSDLAALLGNYGAHE